MGLFSFMGGPASSPVFSSYPIQGGNYLNISLVETCDGKYAVLNDGPTSTTPKVNRLKYSNSFSQINPTVVMTDLPLLTHRPGPSFVTRDGGRWISLVSGWTTGGGFTLYNFGKSLDSPPALTSVLAGSPLAISSISLPQPLPNGSTCVLYTTESGVLGRLIFPNLNPSSSVDLTGYQPPSLAYSSPGKYFINFSATSPLGVVIQGGDSIVVRNATSTGIVKTDVAQRLSLFIPVLAAFLVFGEPYSLMKFSGIGIAIIAIIFSVPWQKQLETSHSYWIYPLIVFIGMGIIDILFKQIARTENIPFTSSLLVVFTLAFIISILYLLYQILANGLKLTMINLICGWILGIANFGNILFYLKAHQTLSNQPSVVFSSMNIGVILLGSAVGVLIFREKLSRLNYAGIVLALISILILSLAP